MKWEELSKKLPESIRAKGEQWMAGAIGEDYTLPQTFDVSGVEIFAVGEWNGDKYTVKDLDDMVSAYQETNTKIKPYLKLGHGDEQGLLRADELPAAGWITNLRRNGKKLLADFTRVPQKIFDLITKAAYRRVSSEIYWNFTLDGKKYPRLLKAVALLGGETPAVHDLGDIIGLYSLSGGVETFSTDKEPKTYEVNQSDLENIQEGNVDQLEKMQALLTESNEKLAASAKEVEGLKAQYAESDVQVKKLSAENVSLSKELGEVKTTKRHAEIRAEIDKLIQEQKIVPAQKESLFTLLSNLPESAEKKYTLGEKSFSSLSDVAMAFVNSGMKAPVAGGESFQGEKQASELTDRAKKYAADNKVSFKDALLAISAAEKGK